MVGLLRTRGSVDPITGGDSYLVQAYWLPGSVGGSAADATDCLARFRAMWNSLGAKIATGCTISWTAQCEVIESTTGALVAAWAATPPAVVTTSGGSSPLPPASQGLIRWHTNTIKRQRFIAGRTYVPLPDEGDNTAAAAPSSSYTTQLQTAANLLLAAGTTASVPVIWSRPSTKGAADGSHGPITSGEPDVEWRTQRRRQK